VFAWHVLVSAYRRYRRRSHTLINAGITAFMSNPGRVAFGVLGFGVRFVLDLAGDGVSGVSGRKETVTLVFRALDLVDEKDPTSGGDKGAVGLIFRVVFVAIEDMKARGEGGDRSGRREGPARGDEKKSLAPVGDTSAPPSKIAEVSLIQSLFPSISGSSTLESLKVITVRAGDLVRVKRLFAVNAGEKGSLGLEVFVG